MEDADRRTLQLNRVFLVKNIANPDDIAEGLYSREIFTEGMKDEIEVNNKNVQEWMNFIYNHQSSRLYDSWGCNMVVSLRLVEAENFDWRLFRVSDHRLIEWFGFSCPNFDYLLWLNWAKPSHSFRVINTVIFIGRKHVTCSETISDVSLSCRVTTVMLSKGDNFNTATLPWEIGFWLILNV